MTDAELLSLIFSVEEAAEKRKGPQFVTTSLADFLAPTETLIDAAPLLATALKLYLTTFAEVEVERDELRDATMSQFATIQELRAKLAEVVAAGDNMRTWLQSHPGANQSERDWQELTRDLR